jgi:solute carrier family 35, member F5
MPLIRGWTRNYVIGLLFIVLVAVIWAASSVLIQLLYTSTDNDFHSPFLVTYIGVSLFTLWLPTQKLTQYLYNRPIIISSTPERVPTAAPIVGRRRTAAVETNTTYHAVNVGSLESPGYNDNDGTAEHNDSRLDPEQDSSLRRKQQEIPVQGLRSGMDHDVVDITADNMDSFLADDDDDDGDDIARASNPQEPMAAWTEADHLRAALYIAPVWFVANWTYNASLAYTSVSSSTVLSSTGSLFTFLFAIWAGDETFSRTALCGVVLGVAGSVLTTGNDESNQGNVHPHGVLGDVLGLISAVGYGMYAVQTRVLCPSDEAIYSMQTLLGYIGLLNMVVLSPLAIYLLLSGSAHLGWTVVSVLVVKGLLDNVLSDYLWLRAVMLTNATTATVGLGLTIPLAFASDVFLDHGSESVISVARVCGALAVLTGFVLVNIGNASTDTAEIGDSEQEALSVANVPNHSRLPLYTDTEQKEPDPDAVMT